MPTLVFRLPAALPSRQLHIARALCSCDNDTRLSCFTEAGTYHTLKIIGTTSEIRNRLSIVSKKVIPNTCCQRVLQLLPVTSYVVQRQQLEHVYP